MPPLPVRPHSPALLAAVAATRDDVHLDPAECAFELRAARVVLRLVEQASCLCPICGAEREPLEILRPERHGRHNPTTIRHLPDCALAAVAGIDARR